MKTAPAVLVLLVASAFAPASDLHPSKMQTETLQQRMDKTQHSMQQMIANHQKLMAQLESLEMKLDQWTKALHNVRLKIEGK